MIPFDPIYTLYLSLFRVNSLVPFTSCTFVCCILLYFNLYPLLQVVSEAQAIPYSIALSVSTQPALPPTHQPLKPLLHMV